MFTVADVANQVRELGKERPDFRYTDEPGGVCNYLDPDGTRCIVGEALSRLGVPDEELRSLNGVGGAIEALAALDYCDYPYAESLLPGGPSGPHNSDTLFLVHTQSWQDGGETWGEAVAKAAAAVQLTGVTS